MPVTAMEVAKEILDQVDCGERVAIWCGYTQWVPITSGHAEMLGLYATARSRNPQVTVTRLKQIARTGR